MTVPRIVRARRWAHHHHTVLIYLSVIGAVALILFGYQQHVSHRFDKNTRLLREADKRSCQNRRILIRNQQVVLAVLERNIEGFLTLVVRSGPARRAFEMSLAQVHIAQLRLAYTPRC